MENFRVLELKTKTIGTYKNIQMYTEPETAYNLYFKGISRIFLVVLYTFYYVEKCMILCKIPSNLHKVQWPLHRFDLKDYFTDTNIIAPLQLVDIVTMMVMLQNCARPWSVEELPQQCGSFSEFNEWSMIKVSDARGYQLPKRQTNPVN